MTTGSVLAQFTITLSQAVSEQVAVEWHTADGTALAGVDYAANKGVVLFAPGEIAKTVEILVYGRAVGSEDRSFFVEMLPPVNAILGASIGECIIHVDTTGSTPVTQIIVPTGPRGLQGDSAYQAWLGLGNTGTEQDFINSLKPPVAEIAQEVAPLIDVGDTMLTAEGTEVFSKSDQTTVKAVARRVAYVGAAKIATVMLADGDNLIAQSDLTGDIVDMSSVGLYPRIMRGTAVLSPQWSIEVDGRLLIKGAVAGDVLYVCQYDAASGQAVTRQSREALRRSCAEAGFNMVPGSFELGGTVTTPTDVLLYEADGKAYSFSGTLPHTVDDYSAPGDEPGLWVDVSIYSLRGNISEPSGGQLVGLPRLNGESGRNVVDLSAERVSIEDFRIPGQVDWTQALADAAAYMIAQSQAGTPKILEFNANEVYEARTMPNWRWHNMWLRGNGATLKNTGYGNTLICDAGATTFQLRNVSIKGFRVQGGPTSGHGLFVRGINASEFDVEVRGCGTGAHAFQLTFTVLNEYRLKASSITLPFVGGAIPLHGIVMSQRDAGEKCSANTFYNPVIEGVSGRGILLPGALQNTFLGGTSESNGGPNVEVQINSYHNKFLGMDIEQAGNGISIIDAGRWNRWTDIYADQQVNISATAVGCKMRDSLMNSVDDQGLGSTLDCIDYNLNSGTWTLSGEAVASQEARRIRSVASGLFLPSKYIDISFGPTGQTIKRHNHAAVDIAAPPVPGSVPGSSVVSGVSVPGAKVNDTVIVTAGQNSNYTVYGVVTAADTVQIRWHQLSGAAASPLPSGGTVRVDTWGH